MMILCHFYVSPKEPHPYDFLDDGKHPLSSLDKEKNSWLIDLNNNYTLKGIITSLFAGDNTNTIEKVKIGASNDLYVDGVEVGGTKKLPMETEQF